MVHVTRQVLFVLQAYVPQEDEAPGWQVPVPLQVPACVYRPAEQVAGAQVVPATYSSQAPAPLHEPSVMHLMAPISAH